MSQVPPYKRTSCFTGSRGFQKIKIKNGSKKSKCKEFRFKSANVYQSFTFQQGKFAKKKLSFPHDVFLNCLCGSTVYLLFSSINIRTPAPTKTIGV